MIRHGIVALALLAFACSQGPSTPSTQRSSASALSTAPASLVRDIRQGTPTASAPTVNWIWDTGTVTYFSGTSASTGTELWRTDGTASGTALVADVCPGTCSSNPSHLGSIDGIAYFSANDGTHGAELWRTDGTPEGTYLVKDANPGATGSGFYSAGP